MYWFLFHLAISVQHGVLEDVLYIIDVDETVVVDPSLFLSVAEKCCFLLVIFRPTDKSCSE